MKKGDNKKVPVSSSSEVPGEDDTGTNSPLIDDFDEELCMELEEVGKELDRYKAESSSSHHSGGGNSTFVAVKDHSSSPLEHPPHGAAKAQTPASPCIVELTQVEAEDVSVLMPEMCQTEADQSEESECQLRALDSLKASLVAKVKVLVTHKTNLTSQKDALLKSFDGDRTKLGEDLQRILSQCKEVDAQIQSLNSQIAMNRKKIIALKSKKHFSEIENSRTQSNSSLVVEKCTPSKKLKDSTMKINGVCETSNSNLVEDMLKTTAKGGEGEGGGVEQISATQSSNHTTTASTVSPALSPSHSKLCHTPDSLAKTAEPPETRKNDEALQKILSKFAMSPSSKNLNTLWCKTCNLFFTNITGYIKHLELPQHLEKEQEEGKQCVTRLFGHLKETPGEEKGSTQEALGVEFLQSTKLIYCSLCDCPLVTREEAASHSHSLQHTRKYKEYILKNTNKEFAFHKAKMIAFTEYYKRRKASEKNKKQRMEAKEDDVYKKAIAKIDERRSKVEGVMRNDEPQKTKAPSEKKGVWPRSENDSCLQGKTKDGTRNVMRESPLMPQKTNVNVKTDKSVGGGSMKRISEPLPTNKRQKLLN